MYQPWSATSADTWEVVDLAVFGVPAKAVVEVAVINSSNSKERRGGVRAVGSSLNRQLWLHESEAGGDDVMIMLVQTNASSQIEHYADTTANVSFILFGYWSNGSYIEKWNNFQAGDSSSWNKKSLSGYGVPSGAVAEVLVYNENQERQFRGGVRTSDSTAQRLFNLHEAESGGLDTATMLVKAGSDSLATIQVYSEAEGDVDFYLMGYWDISPGVFTESFTELVNQPGAGNIWQDVDLTALGVPADAVVSIALANGQTTAESQLGVRRKGSGLDRTLNLHEAESGGDDLGSMHANADSASTIQLFDQNTSQNHRFYLMGWWQLTP